MDWITGSKFITLADYTYSPKEKREDDYDGLPNTFDPHKLKNGDIIYTHTMYVKDLFKEIRFMRGELILITHNSDVNIDDTFKIPPCISKWYAQNVNYINAKIVSVPIGLENDRWFKDVRKKDKMLAKLKEPRGYADLVYMNFNIATNPAKRETIYNTLKDKSWVTVDMGVNGSRFDEYLDNIYNHKFVLCPEGNGIDTHRLWETLYMGSIPIAENNINNSFFTGLPLVLVDYWDSLTYEDLDRIHKEYTNYPYQKEMLTFDYWKNKIIDDRRTITG